MIKHTSVHIKKFCTSRLSSVRHESEDQNGRMYSRERIRRGPTYPEPSYYKHDLEKGIPRTEVKKYTVIARKLWNWKMTLTQYFNGF